MATIDRRTVMKRARPLLSSKWLLRGMAALAAIFAVVLSVVGVSQNSELTPHAFTVFLQFLLVVVFGGLIAETFREREREKQQSLQNIERNEKAQGLRLRRLQDTHSALVATYNRAKRVRRLLRGRAVKGVVHSTDAPVLMAEYGRQMETLIDVQLDLEALKRRAKGGLWDELEGVTREVGEMEKYLGKLIREYENTSQIPAEEDLTQPLRSLPLLKEFVGPYKDAGGFRSNLVNPLHRSLRSLSDAADRLVQMPSSATDSGGKEGIGGSQDGTDAATQRLVEPAEGGEGILIPILKRILPSIEKGTPLCLLKRFLTSRPEETILTEIYAVSLPLFFFLWLGIVDLGPEPLSSVWMRGFGMALLGWRLTELLVFYLKWVFVDQGPPRPQRAIFLFLSNLIELRISLCLSSVLVGGLLADRRWDLLFGGLDVSSVPAWLSVPYQLLSWGVIALAVGALAGSLRSRSGA